VAERLLAPPLPRQIPEHLRIAGPLESGTIDLEGHKLKVVKTGRTDTAHSTVLHVPSIGLIVGGDVVYNGIHPYLGETDAESRLEWIAALEGLAALKPQAVIAGHKVPENKDDPGIIAETQRYLRDFNRLDAVTSNARELYDAMLGCIRVTQIPVRCGAVQTGPSSAAKTTRQVADHCRSGLMARSEWPLGDSWGACRRVWRP
jgi:glyoxylase-like metal-dependent hydrolase (beta-lactamase superfamily II)